MIVDEEKGRGEHDYYVVNSGYYIMIEARHYLGYIEDIIILPHHWAA